MQSEHYCHLELGAILLRDATFHKLKSIRRLNGEGLAKMRNAIIDGLSESLDIFESSTAATGEAGKEGKINRHEVLDLLLITQYFDYLGEVGGGKFSLKKKTEFNTETNFLQHNPGAMKTVREIIKQSIASPELG